MKPWYCTQHNLELDDAQCPQCSDGQRVMPNYSPTFSDALPLPHLRSPSFDPAVIERKELENKIKIEIYGKLLSDVFKRVEEAGIDVHCFTSLDRLKEQVRLTIKPDRYIGTRTMCFEVVARRYGPNG